MFYARDSHPKGRARRSASSRIGWLGERSEYSPVGKADAPNMERALLLPRKSFERYIKLFFDQPFRAFETIGLPQ